jgi:hypothetical protein
MAAAAKKSPRNFSEFPEYTQAAERLVDLQRREAELIEQVNRRPYELARRAEAMANNQDPGPPLVLSEELNEALLIVRKAIKTQQARVDQVKDGLRRKICEGCLPDHRAMVQEQAKAVVQLAEKVTAEQDFRAGLADAGLSPDSFIPQLPWVDLGRLNHSNSRVYLFVDECIKAGYLTGKEQWLREAGWDPISAVAG